MARKILPEKFAKSFGARVRALRLERGWTLEHTEEQGWTSWRHLQKIESGKDVRLTTVVRIANLFGIHPSELLKDI